MSPCRNHNTITQDNLWTFRTVRWRQVPEANQEKIRSIPPEHWVYHLQSPDNVQRDHQAFKSSVHLSTESCLSLKKKSVTTPVPISTETSHEHDASPESPEMLIVDKGCWGHFLLNLENRMRFDTQQSLLSEQTWHKCKTPPKTNNPHTHKFQMTSGFLEGL